ncbi:MAG: glycosyltransferase family 4 protein [Chloroflexi bacterium]|nr:glycosyltransferase family 4 protein [Chloroflexota bacterium]
MQPPLIAIDASRISVAERTGTERYSYEVIAALARIDRWHRYTLYTNGLPPALPPLGPNVTLRSLPLPRLWTHARLGPALVHDRPALLFVPAHVIPLLHPAASVVTIHDLGYLAFPEAHTARRRLELELSTRWNLRAARRVIAISQATRDDLVRQYGADPARVAVVHHGVSAGFQPVADPALRAAARARHGLDAPYFLYVGTIQPRKNLVRLIEAFARAAVPGMLLALAGRRGWLSAPIERRAAELGLGERVRFLGYLPDTDLPALLGDATAFVFPSLYEGFGMPVLEAMACGAPVLTSSTSALPEVAGNAALLVDPHDTAAMADALGRLAADEALRAELRARGYARAALFTWERCARATLAVLEQALGQ